MISQPTDDRMRFKQLLKSQFQIVNLFSIVWFEERLCFLGISYICSILHTNCSNFSDPIQQPFSCFLGKCAYILIIRLKTIDIFITKQLSVTIKYEINRHILKIKRMVLIYNFTTKIQFNTLM